MRTRPLHGILGVITIASGLGVLATAASSQTPGPMSQRYQLTVPIDATGLPPEVRSIGALCTLYTDLTSGRAASGTIGNGSSTDVAVVSGTAHGEVTMTVQATLAPAAVYRCVISFYVVTPDYTGTVNTLTVPRATVPHTGTDVVQGYLTSP